MNLEKPIKLLSEFLASIYYIMFNTTKFNLKLNYLEKRIGRVKLLSYAVHASARKMKVRKLASTRNCITFTQYSAPITFNREMIE